MKYIDAEKLITILEERKGQRDQWYERYGDTVDGAKADELSEVIDIISSLQQEQPDNEDIDKVAQELYEHLYELKRRNNVPTNLYDKQEIIDLWKAGIEYGRNHPKQEQPMPDSTKLIELWHEDKEMLKEKDFRDDPWRLAYNAFMCGFGRGIAVNKQEQQEQQKNRAKRGHKDCNGCEYSRLLKDQIGWQFRGCFGGDYKGKPIAEIELCPLKVANLQEQPEVDLEKEIQSFWNANALEYRLGHVADINFLAYTARHFYELGLNAKKED